MLSWPTIHTRLYKILSKADVFSVLSYSRYSWKNKTLVPRDTDSTCFIWLRQCKCEWLSSEHPTTNVAQQTLTVAGVVSSTLTAGVDTGQARDGPLQTDSEYHRFIWGVRLWRGFPEGIRDHIEGFEGPSRRFGECLGDVCAWSLGRLDFAWTHQPGWWHRKSSGSRCNGYDRRSHPSCLMSDCTRYFGCKYTIMAHFERGLCVWPENIKHIPSREVEVFTTQASLLVMNKCNNKCVAWTKICSVHDAEKWRSISWCGCNTMSNHSSVANFRISPHAVDSFSMGSLS